MRGVSKAGAWLNLTISADPGGRGRAHPQDETPWLAQENAVAPVGFERQRYWRQARQIKAAQACFLAAGRRLIPLPTGSAQQRCGNL
jgi:hypothetical protein